MNKQFFIILGRSGAGKGTQAQLLKKRLEDLGSIKVEHVTTGGGFRDFIKQDNYIAGVTRIVEQSGGLPPEFLAIWNWSNIFINSLTEDTSVILDGAPRRLKEKEVFDGLVSFLGYERPTVIYLDVPEGSVIERLSARGRADDTQVAVTKRLSWFEENVLPVVDAFMHDPRYTFVHVNGKQSVDEVFAELTMKANLE
jgi:adenylate kinase